MLHERGCPLVEYKLRGGERFSPRPLAVQPQRLVGEVDRGHSYVLFVKMCARMDKSNDNQRHGVRPCCFHTLTLRYTTLSTVPFMSFTRSQAAHNANRHLDATANATPAGASASRCKSVSLHLAASCI